MNYTVSYHLTDNAGIPIIPAVPKLKLTKLLNDDITRKTNRYEKGNLAKDSWKNEKTKRNDIFKFMQSRGLMNIDCESVNVAFAEGLLQYMIDNGAGKPHAKKIVRYLKMNLRSAKKLELIKETKIDYVNTNITYKFQNNHLEILELNRIVKRKFSKAIQKAADLFVFGCFTGMDHCEMKEFDFNNDVHTMPDGTKWIFISRRKNVNNDNEPCYIPLFPEAMALLKKWKYNIPVQHINTVNKYLKAIFAICGIKKKATTKVWRKTFAIVVGELFDMSTESLSFMMGHENISTTIKFYSRVRLNKVKDEIKSKGILIAK